MFVIDQEKTRKILVDEYGYKPINADLFLKRFPPIHDELADVVATWLDSREIQDISIGGLALKDVMQIQRCHFLIAIQYLNRLLDEDLSPKEKEAHIQSLRTPPVIW